LWKGGRSICLQQPNLASIVLSTTLLLGAQHGSKETSSSTCETGREGRSQGRCARQNGSQAGEEG